MTQQQIDNYFVKAVNAKRRGEYRLSKQYYDNLYKELELGNLSLEDAYSLCSNMGKLYFILEKYEESCCFYITCFDALKRALRNKGKEIRSPRDLYEADWNSVRHFGMSLLAYTKNIDTVMIHSYRCSIDPFYGENNCSQMRQSLENVDEISINVALDYLYRNKSFLFE